MGIDGPAEWKRRAFAEIMEAAFAEGGSRPGGGRAAGLSLQGWVGGCVGVWSVGVGVGGWVWVWVNVHPVLQTSFCSWALQNGRSTCRRRLDGGGVVFSSRTFWLVVSSHPYLVVRIGGLGFEPLVLEGS